MLIRSLLFAPANRHDMIAKFPRMNADVYVVDLEDATPAPERVHARAALREALAIAHRGERTLVVFVRINGVRSSDFAADVEALRDCGADGIVLPKAISRADIEELDARSGAHHALPIIAGIESIQGVLNAVEICAAPRVAAAYFGAEDFAVEMGARRSRDGTEVLYARSRVVLAAKAARVLAIDQAVIEVRDDEQFRRDSKQGRDLGYDGKICLLPRQVSLANECFSASPAEVERARRLVTAYREAQRGARGTIDFEGTMVDEPILKRAEQIIAADCASKRAQ